MVQAAHAKARVRYLHNGLPGGAARGTLNAPASASAHLTDIASASASAATGTGFVGLRLDPVEEEAEDAPGASMDASRSAHSRRETLTLTPLLGWDKSKSCSKRAEAALGSALVAQYEWSELPWTVSLRFVPGWLVLTSTGLTFCLSDASYRIFNRYEYIPTTVADKLLLGVGGTLLWGSVLQFMAGDPRVFAVVTSIGVAAPRLLSYVVGVVPIFSAFVFFAISFWGTELGAFSTLSQATKTLFSLMNGDSIHEVLSLMKLKNVTVTALFAVAFMIISFYLIMNICIAIVEEAYFMAKSRRRHLETLVERRLALAVESMGPVASRRGGETGDGDDDDDDDERDERRDERRMRILGAQHEDAKDIMKSLLAGASAGGGGGYETVRGAGGEGYSGGGGDSKIGDGSSGITGTGRPSRQTRQAILESTQLTRQEYIAEVYMLGRTHFEYSKMMDYLAGCMLGGQGEGQGEGEGEGGGGGGGDWDGMEVPQGT